MEEVKEKELLNFKNLFIEYYNSKEPIKHDTMLQYAKILNLETRTQHDISMIFLAGYLAEKADHKAVVETMQKEHAQSLWIKDDVIGDLESIIEEKKKVIMLLKAENYDLAKGIK